MSRRMAGVSTPQMKGVTSREQGEEGRGGMRYLFFASDSM